jgi:hypothetical protein
MKLYLFASLCAAALLTTPALAQGSDSPQSAQPAVTAPTPAQPAQGASPQAEPSQPSGGQASPAPAATGPTSQQAAADGASSRPANLCQELVAYLTPKPEPGAAPASNAAPAPTGAASAGGAAQTQAAAPASGPQASAGAQGTGTSVPQGSAAPAVEAAQPPKPKDDTAPQQSGLTGPIPKTQAAAPAPQQDLPQAQAFAEANDFRGCKEMAQRLRLAGKPLPPAVIALAGMPVETLERARTP